MPILMVVYMLVYILLIIPQEGLFSPAGIFGGCVFLLCAVMIIAMLSCVRINFKRNKAHKKDKLSPKEIPTTKTSSDKNKHLVCQYCGSGMKHKWKNCRFCGAPL